MPSKALFIILAFFLLKASFGETPFDLIRVDIGNYSNAEQAIKYKDSIDWNSDKKRALAISSAYAAIELQKHLKLIGWNLDLCYSDCGNRPSLVLSTFQKINSDSLKTYQNSLGDQGFIILNSNPHTYIIGNSRLGILYGVYELLNRIGFRWYSPNETFIPNDYSGNSYRFEKIVKKPNVEYRGFWIRYDHNVNDAYLIWMARNRFNLGAAYNHSLRKLLGIKEWGGGHHLLREEFSKKGLFEEHPEYYGEFKGKRLAIASTGSYMNPNFSNSQACEYFAKNIIARLDTGDLKEVDILNIWPSDRRFWRAFDQSRSSKILGNYTDNMLNLYLIVCKQIKKAVSNGTLNRDVTIAGISYYLTWKCPTNRSLIDNLSNSNYVQIFYLNDRSWSSEIDDRLNLRWANRELNQDLDAWDKLNSFKTGIVEYYNYNIYSGLGMIDYNYFGHNYSYMNRVTRKIFAYMHPVEVNSGSYKLLHQRLLISHWNSYIDSLNLSKAVNEETELYFKNRYGEMNEEMREVYDLMERSIENCREMFQRNSLRYVLFQHIQWAKPHFEREVAVKFIPRYLNGGVQNLPSDRLYRGDSGKMIKEDRESFLGLNESIALQRLAKEKWEQIVSLTEDNEIKKHILEDIEWFKVASSRYRLIHHAAVYYVKEMNGLENLQPEREKMAVEVDYLESHPLLDNNLTPTKQTNFLLFYRTLANLPGEKRK